MTVSKTEVKVLGSQKLSAQIMPHYIIKAVGIDLDW